MESKLLFKCIILITYVRVGRAASAVAILFFRLQGLASPTR